MFKFNLIQKAIDCATGNIIPTQQIVNACLTDGKVVSLVFDNAKVVIVQDGTIMYSDLESAMTHELTCFFAQNKQIRHTRKIVKRLETELKSFYTIPDAVDKKKFTKVIDLQDLAEGDTIVLRNGDKLVIKRMKWSDNNTLVQVVSSNAIALHYWAHSGYHTEHTQSDVVEVIKG